MLGRNVLCPPTLTPRRKTTRAIPGNQRRATLLARSKGARPRARGTGWEPIVCREALINVSHQHTPDFQLRGGAMLTLVLAVVLLLVRPSSDFQAAQTARIRRHLATVEAELRGKDVSALTPAQRQARAKNLDVLHEYWVRGVFPVNTDFPSRHVPYFVDRYGTRCAMAYLIEQSGRGDIVRRIATTQNNAYVRDLQGDADLGAWLRENGLTAAEAARIQPSYGSPFDDFAGRWEGTMTFGPHDSLTLRYVLTNNGANEAWTLTLPDHPSIQTRVVALAGDSLVTEAEPVPSVLGPAHGMTRLRTVMHYG